MHQCISYSKDQFQKIEILDNLDVSSLMNDRNNCIWIKLNSIDEKFIKQLDSQLQLHELIIEDMLSPHQRPKIEDYDDYTFITIQVPNQSLQGDFEVTYEQISLLVVNNVLITIQEQPSSLFSSVLKKLSKNNSRVRTHKIDYLVYAVIDEIIDICMALSEQLGDEIDLFETILVDNPSQLSLKSLYQVKKAMIELRKLLLPLRNMLSYLLTEKLAWLNKKTLPFIRDCYDHVIRTVDNLELQRDIVSNILDIYLSSANNRMNEVMKVLAIFGSIFIPLTFVTSLYGMNFQYMPELKWHYGYYYALGVMGTMVAGLVIFFKRKNWF